MANRPLRGAPCTVTPESASETLREKTIAILLDAWLSSDRFLVMRRPIVMFHGHGPQGRDPPLDTPRLATLAGKLSSGQ